MKREDEKSKTAQEASLPMSEAGYEGLVQKNPDNRNTLSLLISGVHCAGCIQKIESSLYQNEAIQNARLNFSTGRLNLIWDGHEDLANDFVKTIKNLGYSVSPYNADLEKATAENENRFLLTCLGVAGFAMGNIMLLSIGLWITNAETMGLATRELMHWVAALIGVPAVLFSGRPFFTSAIGALKNGHTNMDVPISLALLLATGMSVSEMMRGGEHVYFDSAVMLMFFLLIGRYLDFRARRTARSAATDLMQTLSGFASVVDGNKTKRMLIRDLREGMSVSIASGENIPVDGIVEEGKSTVDTSLVTGETLPRTVEPEQDVFGGTLNISAPIIMRVAKAAEDSLLADVVRLMEKAEQGQAKYVRLADKAAKLYTPVVHTLALLAFILWWPVLGADWQEALMVAVTVLIITCPCALGLAVPVVQVLASGLLMKKGILVKSGDALERMASIDTVIFDKTGTLTAGHPALLGDHKTGDIRLAASLASGSNHPLSKALSAAYDGEYLKIENRQEHPGQGLEGHWQNKKIRLGSRDWCGNDKAPAHNGPELWLSIEGKEPQPFFFSDQLRTDAKETVSKLQQTGIHTVLLSGDRKATTEEIAREVGIETALGQQTPVDKYNYLEKLKEEGHKVLMVGDGLNDAPVLAAADVSMAPGTAIDMARNAADIVFMGDKLSPVSFAKSLSIHTQELVKQNFILAVLYNVIAIPLAFAGLVTPMVAAIAMSGSSLLVIANSFRLKWK